MDQVRVLAVTGDPLLDERAQWQDGQPLVADVVQGLAQWGPAQPLPSRERTISVCVKATTSPVRTYSEEPAVFPSILNS
ncbi:hypothetical protein BJF83_18955 [Nocardiopsis sp. CNR-923]|nr:hypothetical protein BJF83_18955 [Nocardiopsis sp. CNR-923]